MRADLIARREAARDRLHAALARAQEPGDPQLRGELESVLADLEQIHLDIDIDDDAAGAELELGRLLSSMADVLFEIGPGSDAFMLQRALRLYDRATKLVGSTEPERSTIGFKHANTLRVISRGEDRGLLTLARDGLGEALAGLRGSQPELAAAAQDALAQVEQQLSALSQVEARYAERRALVASLRATSEQQMKAARAGGAPMSSEAAILATTYARYQKEIEAERLAPEDRPVLDGIFDELFVLLATTDESVEGLQARVEKMGSQMVRMSELMSPRPTARSGPSPVSRRQVVERELEHARRFLFEQTLQRFPSKADRNRGNDLGDQVLDRRLQLGKAAGDADVMKLEREAVRLLCLDIREFSRRKHLTLARPEWSTRDVARRTNSVFFSGGPRALSLVEAAASRASSSSRRRRSTARIPPSRVGGSCARPMSRYSISRPTRSIARPSATSSASRVRSESRRWCSRNARILCLSTSRSIRSSRTRIWAWRSIWALYRPLSAESGDSVAAFVAMLKRAVREGTTTEGRYVLKQLDEDVNDPTRVADLFVQLRDAERLPLLALRPAWPTPPPSQERRCFHVMPFGPSWAAEVSRSVAATCQAAGVTYVRGDIASGARIVHLIWNEIGQATHVVVDITGSNLNVFLELGMAHTLGRPCLIVARADSDADIAKQLPASLAKFRVMTYGAGRDISALDGCVRAFLTR